MPTYSGNASLDAFIVGGRWKHHRQHDHYGAESDLYVALAGPVGPWPEGTPVHYVIKDMFSRVLALHVTSPTVKQMAADAVIMPSFSIQWGIFGSFSSSFTEDAWLCGGGSFALDAELMMDAGFYVDAVVIP